MHPAAPHTRAQIAAEALAAVHAGAQSVHVHPFDDNGGQTLAPEPCAVTIRAVRAAWRRQRSSRYTVGDGIASWAVNRRAIPRGHGIRTGLEDTPVLPDERLADGNGDLVAAAAAMLADSAPE